MKAPHENKKISLDQITKNIAKSIRDQSRTEEQKRVEKSFKGKKKFNFSDVTRVCVKSFLAGAHAQYTRQQKQDEHDPRGRPVPIYKEGEVYAIVNKIMAEVLNGHEAG